MYPTWRQSAGKTFFIKRKESPETIRRKDFIMKRKLNAQWIVGFTDGEGCFRIDIFLNTKMSIGFQVLPEFVITQHKRSIEVLYDLKSFFGCGVVRKKRGQNDNIYCYKVRNQRHLMLHIIPFFEKHSLLTKKKIDFINFRRILLLMKKKEHLTSEGLKKIRKLREKILR